MRNPFSKYYFEPCPDGIKRKVYKNIDDAFPIYCKNISSNYKAIFDVINEVKANLNVDNKSHIHDLLSKLDKINSDMQSQFRDAYADYKNDPYGKSDHLSSEIQKITEREINDRQFQIFLDKIILINKGGLSDTAIKNLILEAKSILLGPSISKNILTNLSKVTKTVEAWQEELHE